MGRGTRRRSREHGVSRIESVKRSSRTMGISRWHLRRYSVDRKSVLIFSHRKGFQRFVHPHAKKNHRYPLHRLPIMHFSQYDKIIPKGVAFKHRTHAWLVSGDARSKLNIIFSFTKYSISIGTQKPIPQQFSLHKRLHLQYMPVSIPPHLLETVQHFSRNMGHASSSCFGVTITIRCLVEIPQAAPLFISSASEDHVFFLQLCCSAVQCGAPRQETILWQHQYTRLLA